MRHHKHTIIKHKFLIILIALILFFIANAFLTEHWLEIANMSLMSTVVITSFLTLEGRNRYTTFCAIILGIAAIVISGFTDMLAMPKGVQIARLFVLICFFGIITFICLFSTLSKRKVTINVLYGAAVTYLLIGLLFANVFYLIDVSHHNAFNFHGITRTDAPLQIFTYYSFVTLTTLGYGDITPVSNIARTFAWFEAALGQIYLTILIAQLVGSFIAHKGKMNENE